VRERKAKKKEKKGLASSPLSLSNTGGEKRGGRGGERREGINSFHIKKKKKGKKGERLFSIFSFSTQQREEKG